MTVGLSYYSVHRQDVEDKLIERGKLQMDRVQKSVDAFESGVTCSIAVFSGVWDLLGLNDITGKRVACGFGGGIGGRRELCGAVSGMILSAAIDKPEITTQKDKEEAAVSVRKMLALFEEKYGTLQCQPLQDLAKESSIPGERECTRYVRACAEIIRDTFRL